MKNWNWRERRKQVKEVKGGTGEYKEEIYKSQQDITMKKCASEIRMEEGRQMKRKVKNVDGKKGRKEEKEGRGK